MMTRMLSRVLAGEELPSNPGVKPDHRRILYRAGDNTSVH